jgi:two-component system, LuxR family, response regulator FixJ
MPTQRLVHILGGDVAVCAHLERLLRSLGLAALVDETGAAVPDDAVELTGGCILFDIGTTASAGLATLSRLKGLAVRLPVVVTAPPGSVDLAHAMSAGIVDFIERPFDERRLIAALEAALARSADVAAYRQATEAAHRLTALSRRERQVLDAIVAGHPNKVIAYNLAISMRTVEVHRARMLKRLRLRTMAEAIRLAVLASLVPTDDADSATPLADRRPAGTCE